VTKARSIIALLAIAGTAVMVGCGSSGSEDGGPAAVVSVSRAVGIGPLLVNGKEITLYEYSKDKGTRSECNDDTGCSLSISPLLTNGAPRAEGDAVAAKLGTTERIDGTTQVTYAGHPLYTWRGEEPGQARGRGVKAFDYRWYALRPSGRPVPSP
jgi:predicted lipoprotein with Yx(FWY)xxD motif